MSLALTDKGVFKMVLLGDFFNRNTNNSNKKNSILPSLLNFRAGFSSLNSMLFRSINIYFAGRWKTGPEHERALNWKNNMEILQRGLLLLHREGISGQTKFEVSKFGSNTFLNKQQVWYLHKHRFLSRQDRNVHTMCFSSCNKIELPCSISTLGNTNLLHADTSTNFEINPILASCGLLLFIKKF